MVGSFLDFLHWFARAATFSRGAAWIKSGVASLRKFRCGIGGQKLRNWGEVCGHKMEVKVSDFPHNVAIFYHYPHKEGT